MIGVEFDRKTASYGFASKVSKDCLAQGMLLLTTSCFEVVRFIPPLNVSQDEIEKGLKIFETAVSNALSQK